MNTNPNTPHITILNQETQPKSRQEYYVMHRRALIDVIKSGNLTQIIQSYLNCFSVALPEIPDDKYPKKKLYTMEPKYADVRKEYLSSHPMLIPQLEIGHQRHIERLQKEKYIMLLQEEMMTIEDLLKKHTNWNFGEITRQTYGE